MKTVLKVYNKGIIVLPKWVREKIGISEGDSLIIEVKDSSVILTPLVPKRVKLGGKVSKIARDIKKEEIELE